MKYRGLFFKESKGATIRSQWLTSNRGHRPFIITLLPPFSSPWQNTATPGKVISLTLLFHKLQSGNVKKIAMIIGQTERERDKKKKERRKKRRKKWVDVAGSKSPNSFFRGAVYQPRAEGVMVFLFS